jgi:hypothetical protein
MVGTLVVTLPSSYTGGELMVGHNEEWKAYRGSKTALSLVAFYADCRHEVLSEYGIQELIDADITLTHCTGPAGTRLEETALPVDGDEVYASSRTGDLKPYSSAGEHPGPDHFLRRRLATHREAPHQGGAVPLSEGD